MTRPDGAGANTDAPAQRGFAPGHRVEKEAHRETVVDKPVGYATDEWTVFVNWDSWPAKPNPSGEAARLLVLA